MIVIIIIRFLPSLPSPRIDWEAEPHQNALGSKLWLYPITESKLGFKSTGIASERSVSRSSGSIIAAAISAAAAIARGLEACPLGFPTGDSVSRPNASLDGHEFTTVSS